MLHLTREMGLNRRSGGKKTSFVESVQELVEAFYRDVVQGITPWTPPPAKLPERPAAPPTEPTPSWQRRAPDTRPRALCDPDGRCPGPVSSVSSLAP